MKLAFTDAINQLQNNGYSKREAIEVIENDRRRFDALHAEQMKGHLERSNNSQLSLISHTTTLSTITLTALGILLTQFSGRFNEIHEIVLLFIISLEILALVFGLVDYLKTIQFHSRWAKRHYDINQEVAAKFISSELQKMSDLIKIQDKHIDGAPQRTNPFMFTCMVASSLLGLILLPVLFYSYLFDVPDVKTILEILGPLSILLCWAGLFFLIWKWKGDNSMTFSQHAARKRSSIIYYAAMWLLVLPPFYWFLMVPFSEKLVLGMLFQVLVSYVH